MSTEQIVLLIILLVSFAIILFFLFRLNLGKTTDQETCHNSVATRGSGVLPSKNIVPLNCKTQYICISKDGTCAEMTSPQIEKVKTKEEVYSILANQMADCWWMFGEGKINYVPDGAIGNLYCSICSQISFDKSINFFPKGEIDKKEFYTYLSRTNVSGKDISYLEYLTKLKGISGVEETLKKNSKLFGNISLSNQYYIVMGITNKVSALSWGAIGVGSALAGIFLGVITGGISIPPTIAIIAGAAGGGVAGYFVGTTVIGESGQEFLTPTIVAANSETFDALKCNSITTSA